MLRRERYSRAASGIKNLNKKGTRWRVYHKGGLEKVHAYINGRPVVRTAQFYRYWLNNVEAVINYRGRLIGVLNFSTESLDRLCPQEDNNRNWN